MRTYGLGAIVALLLTFFGNLALIGILCLILALPIMLLWIWLIPSIFGLPALTYLNSKNYAERLYLLDEKHLVHVGYSFLPQ